MVKHIYTNNRNPNKHIEVVEYDKHHIYACQYMRWGTVLNRTGARARSRYKLANILAILSDYHYDRAEEGVIYGVKKGA